MIDLPRNSDSESSNEDDNDNNDNENDFCNSPAFTQMLNRINDKQKEKILNNDLNNGCSLLNSSSISYGEQSSTTCTSTFSVIDLVDTTVEYSTTKQRK